MIGATLVATLAACSQTTAGSGIRVGPLPTSTAPTTSSPSTSPSSSSSRPSSPSPTATGGTARLQAIVLTSDDLPPSWDGSPYDPASDDPADKAALVKCVGGRDTTAAQTGEVHSDDFDSGDAEISSAARSFRTADDLNAELAIYQSPKLASCYQQGLRDSAATELPAGAKLTESSVNFVTGANGGPANVVVTGHMRLTVTQNGQAVTIYQDVVIMRGNLVESEVVFVNTGAQVSPALQTQLVQTVAKRTAS